MLRGVSESAHRHNLALSYVPVAGALLAGTTGEYRLGDLIAEGGEGKVFEVEGRDDLVAKVYKAVDSGRKEKLRLMVHLGTRGLRKVSAWPLSPLSDSSDETVGFVMESLVAWQPLHNAYQIRSRLKLFPHHSYAFLVRVARNLATCVHHIHEDGMVIGDLNESNVFVSSKAMVKLIDADSFQIEGPTTLFPCKVGKAELLPPELQGHSLEGLHRTADQDRFSLAVLIFQTLVFGRHPFAGRTSHQHDLTLEHCIEHGYYAYTQNRDTPVKPPPRLSLEWLPDSVRALFEQAFQPDATSRPTAKQWYFALKELEADLKTCKENPSHLHWSGVQSCPWCELEDYWKIAVFRPALMDPEQEFEVGEILTRVLSIPIPDDFGKDVIEFDYRTLTPAQMSRAQSFFVRLTKNWGWFIFVLFQLANAFGPLALGPLIFGAAIVAVAAGITYGRPDRIVKRASRHLSRIAEKWQIEADPAVYREALQEYTQTATLLKDVKATYNRRKEKYVEQLHAADLSKYLQKYSILIADAGPLGSEKLSSLFDSGMKTADDILEERFRNLPRIVPAQDIQALIVWRKSLEAQFWKSHSYKLTIHQERTLLLAMRKDNDLSRASLEKAPQELEELSERLRNRQMNLVAEAEEYVDLLKLHGPKLLALEGQKALQAG